MYCYMHKCPYVRICMHLYVDVWANIVDFTCAQCLLKYLFAKIIEMLLAKIKKQKAATNIMN